MGRLALGESTTVVVLANLPSDTYILIDELPNRNISITLEGLHITQAVSICLDGKIVVCVVTNRTIGPLLSEIIHRYVS